jgi:prevent-host-death family protein
MTRTLNIAEAKAHLSEIVASAAAGEDIIIARAGKPMVRLVQVVETPKQKRRIGQWDGVYTASEIDFLLAPLPADEQAALEGEWTDEFGRLKPDYAAKISPAS